MDRASTISLPLGAFLVHPDETIIQNVMMD